MEKKIPARIIQTWKTRELPTLYRRFRHQLRRLNPHYEFKLFDDDEMAGFIRQAYPRFLQTFEGLQSMVERTDLFRLLAVHKLGGFYLDMDVLVTRPLEKLRRYSCVFPFECQSDPFFCVTYQQLESIGQYAFGATPGHPFLMGCAESIRRAASDPQWANIPPAEITASFLSLFGDDKAIRTYYCTGPALVTRVYTERPDLRDAVKIIYAYDHATERFLNWCFGVYGIHAMTGTWKSGAGRPWHKRLVRALRARKSLWEQRRRMKRCIER